MANTERAREKEGEPKREALRASAEAGQLQLEITRLQEELSRCKDLASKSEEYLELARRLKADFANYQDRIQRERSEWKRQALDEFIADFLPALDAFTWARFEEPTLMESLHLVEREFLRVLAKHGIVPIETRGQPFDPGLHEAVGTEESEEVPPETVLEEVRRGWTLDGHVIRPASVRISRRKGEPEDRGTGSPPPGQ